LDRPDQAAGLVLIGSGARLRVSPEIFAMLEEDWPAGIDTLVDWSLAPSASPELRERAKSWHVTVGRESTKADYTACNGFDVTERLAELNLPTLVLVGDQDRMTPLKYSTYLHQHIHGSSLTVVPGAGHLVMAEKPPETSDAIKAFLNTLS
jgi:pimeloyl-ACP methyl ester carboxylesterase